MIRKDTPEIFMADIKEYLLPALRRHYHQINLSHPDPVSSDLACLDCPYGPDYCGSYLDGCHHIFMDFLPDLLRAQGDDRSLALAARLEVCAREDHDLCLECPYFDRCQDENIDYVLEDVYLHLHRKGMI